MSAESVTYVDSSAIVKLAVSEPESSALRKALSRHQTLVTSALARTEVARALLPLGAAAACRGDEVMRRLQLLRVNDRVLIAAGRMEPPELRSLDAIHLATASQLGAALKRVVTYDARMAEAARALGWPVSSPGATPSARS
jgi:predicted nucleic acid-binding protein